jgi:hypothetical protein
VESRSWSVGAACGENETSHKHPAAFPLKESIDLTLRAAGGKDLPGAKPVAPIERGAVPLIVSHDRLRAFAGAATVGQGRKPRSGGASRDSLDGLPLVRPIRGKRSSSRLCKI